MSKEIELDDVLGEAQSLITALFLAAGAIGDQQSGAALQVVASAALDDLMHARRIIDDIREQQLAPAVQSPVNEANVLQLGSDIAALSDRFDRIKAKLGGQNA